MTLNSLYFIPFFAIVLFILFLIQWIGKLTHKKVDQLQIILLLFVSYLFIALSNVKFCIILIVLTLVTYIAAIQIGKEKNKKLCLGIAIIVLLASLGYFKYTNFFISSFAYIFGKDAILLKIILPLGISFYIFTAIGYLIDVYQKKYDAEKNIVHVALLLSFFPKIISGPIVRGKDFLPQIKNYKGIQLQNVLDGVQIFVIGLFQKIVLADHLGVFVNDVYAAPQAFHTITVILAVVSYALQIYFDFAGYSNMAIGASKMLGINIKKNFNLPYLAKSPSEFWERWHISLSSWFKDYLYIPLGGSRKGVCRTYLNLFLVMLVSGLWHGAGWTFVLWGVLHGIYSCIFRWIETKTKKVTKKTSVLRSVILIFINFVIVTIFWIFFRASSIANAVNILKNCFTIHDGIIQPYLWTFFAIGILLISYIIMIKQSKKENVDGINCEYPLLDLSKISSQVIFFTFVGLTIILGYYGNTAFIYGNF